MQNKGIYTDISRNAIAIRAESARNSPQHIQKRRNGSTPTESGTPEQIKRKQSAAEDPARTVSRYQADRAGMIQRYAVQRRPIPTGTRHSLPCSPKRSPQTGAACHGQPVPDFSRLSGQGSVQPVQCSPVCHARDRLSADFCEFFSRNQTKQPEQLCPG